MKKGNSLKAIALAIGLAALALPLDAQVIYYWKPYLINGQNNPGFLYGTNVIEEEEEEVTESGMLRRGSRGGSGGFFIHPQTFFDGENYGYNLYNGTFEDVTPELPLGSGLFIMAAAGAGYALKKRKDNKKQ